LSSPDGEVPLEETAALLRLKLESGAISATGVTQSGERKAIANFEWLYLHFNFRRHRKGDCIVYKDAKKWDADTLPEYARVCVPVKEMLRDFPALKAGASPTQNLSFVEAKAHLKQEIERLGGFISQNDAADFLRVLDHNFNRDAARELAKELTGNEKLGRPTKKRK
jgi:hypothetical protein